MLADSVESATRALQDPSPERIRELVKNIVDGKIGDGQLSDAPLTLREIDLIQEQFVKVVSGMFHHRLDYPATQHLTKALGEGAPASPHPPPEGPDSPSGDEGPRVQGSSRHGGEKAGGKKIGNAAKDEQLPLTPPEEVPTPQGPHGEE
jgi:hypothetical protein